MAKPSNNLVIVESPAKAKTIQRFLGSDFTVRSSIGHIRSIPKKVKGGAEPIDIKNGFKTQYEVDPDKRKVITELKAAVKDAGQVWLATDEDREGEAIAWHLCEVLKLDPKTTKRIVFHEITKPAIEAALSSPRTVDMRLVQAQQARQILDRLVGFELSPVVWQKVPGGKSAGRVQSPAVRLLVEREREIEAFSSAANFKISAIFNHGTDEFKAELNKRFETEKQALNFLESIKDADFSVSRVTTSPASRNPAAPFTTSTLQQEANARLGFGARATMSSAQQLYQAGKITYMRTDSVVLSRQALAAAADFIKKTYGEKYSQVRNFKTKSASAQEAHEAIRPTDMSLEKAGDSPYDQKLYDLIRRRTLASQMAPAQLEKTVITINISGHSEAFEAKGEVIIFDGFLKVYGTSKTEEVLPKLQSGDSLTMATASGRQTFARPPARYTEGSLVKKLEELGIGRPSTYATIINTILSRGYAEKGESEGEPRQYVLLELKNSQVSRLTAEEKSGSTKGRLVPTAAGRILSDFLSENFQPVVDYGFTAEVEEEFDQIAADKLERNRMLANFYGPFHQLIEKSGKIERSKVAQARLVGDDPKTGLPIYARYGRFGPVLQLGEAESDTKPQFVPLPKGQQVDTIALPAALKAFELPKIVGQTEDGQDIKANIGRFGPYIQVGSTFVSIRGQDPHDITEEEARQLYAAKLKSEAEKVIQDFGNLKVLNGRFGPYATDGSKNAKIPKDRDPKKLSKTEVEKLISESGKLQGRGRGRRKKS